MTTPLSLWTAPPEGAGAAGRDAPEPRDWRPTPVRLPLSAWRPMDRHPSFDCSGAYTSAEMAVASPRVASDLITRFHSIVNLVQHPSALDLPSPSSSLAQHPARTVGCCRCGIHPDSLYRPFISLSSRP